MSVLLVTRPYLVKIGSVEHPKNIFSSGQVEMFHKELFSAGNIQRGSFQSVLDGKQTSDSTLRYLCLIYKAER